MKTNDFLKCKSELMLLALNQFDGDDDNKSPYREIVSYHIEALSLDNCDSNREQHYINEHQSIKFKLINQQGIIVERMRDVNELMIDMMTIVFAGKSITHPLKE